MSSYTEYEYRVAMALASNPGLVCLDDMNYFSLEEGEPAESSWDLPTLSDTLDERDDYDPLTARVDVFAVSLNTTRDQQLRKRPFKFLPAVRVVSSKVNGIMPAADLIMVDAFPLTEGTVLEIVKQHLLRTEYAKDQDKFLWGPEVVNLKER